MIASREVGDEDTVDACLSNKVTEGGEELSCTAKRAGEVVLRVLPSHVGDALEVAVGVGQVWICRDDVGEEVVRRVLPEVVRRVDVHEPVMAGATHESQAVLGTDDVPSAPSDDLVERWGLEQQRLERP